MPSPSPSSKRERLARFISRFRSKRASGSPLVVQTGFPTSLADLVVKNRAKFKKRKKHSQRSSDIDPSPPVAFRSESVGSGDLLAPAVESPARINEEIEPPSVPAPPPMRRRGVGIGLGFLIVKVAALVVLAVGRKWVVAGITVLTFGALILEVSGLLRPGSSERNAAVERFDLRGRGLVSPIREVEDHRNSECPDSRSDFGAVVNDNMDRVMVRQRSNEMNHLENDIGGFSSLVSPIREIESENHRIGRVRDVSVQSKGNLGNSEDITKNKEPANLYKSKRIKLFRKLFKRKNGEKKDEKSSSLDGSIDSNEVRAEEEEECSVVNDAKEDSDEEFFSSEDNDNEGIEIGIEIGIENATVIRDDGNEIRIGRWRKLVFFVVVLLGLLGGKTSALFFTVVCFLLSGYTGTVWKKWKTQRIDRFV